MPLSDINKAFDLMKRG